MSENKILSIKNLSVSFLSEKKSKEVIHSISYDLNKNEILGIVGESGSGKSVSSLAILGLLPKKTSRITEGEILLGNQNLLTLTEAELQTVRGKQVSMIFQEPMSSLNPSMTCGSQVAEIL
ncbi:MAG: ABC transporter ATP-binding protein, partial [Mangrovimonas sp.]|nr:ABC transporter ATP-binding protein [Mangrovimonas sp.]